MEALGDEQARAGLPIANLYADSSPLDFFVENAFHHFGDDFRAGPDVRRLIELLQAAGCRVCEECANVNVMDRDIFVSLVVDGGLDVTHFKFGFSLTDIRVADMSLGFEPGCNGMDPYGLPFAALPFYTGGGTEPGHAERECVRRLVEAGADMWPFGEVGLGVDSPPSAEFVTRDTQRLMASIVWPDTFTYRGELHDVEPGNVLAADRAYVERYFDVFAPLRELRRLQANWERRGIVLICLLRHCTTAAAGGGEGAGAAACDPAPKKATLRQSRRCASSCAPGTTGAEQQQQLLATAASIMVRLHLQEVAITEIFAYL
eukprot:g1397.t1